MMSPAPLTAAEEAFGLRLPSRRDEDWKWTDLRRLISKPYGKASLTAKDADIDRLVAASPFADVKATRLVIVNGVLDAKRSQMKVAPATAPGNSSETVVALASALAAEGVALSFEGNAERPIEIVHVATPGAARGIATRHSITVAAGASATVIETFVGEGDYLAASVIDISLGDGARLDRVKVVLDSAEASHLAQVNATLGKEAVLRDFTLTAGAALARHNGTITFTGQGADAKISGAYLLAGQQHADTRLVVDHAVPHCTSRELFKCVMDDHARGIFQGKVIVRPDAQKTDGKQSSHALLLSETAEFDAKPELEIYADDVVCGHGATSGDLNPDHLFYLLSRGIPKAQARGLLVAAFVGEAFDAVDHEGIREALVTLAATRLG
ncbi:MAG: Fe-S cluster assembly protein SufD [Hyphomicrobiales bacterium]